MLCMHASVHVIESSWRNAHAIMSVCKWDVQCLRIVFGSSDCVSANCVSCRAWRSRQKGKLRGRPRILSAVISTRLEVRSYLQQSEMRNWCREQHGERTRVYGCAASLYLFICKHTTWKSSLDESCDAGAAVLLRSFPVPVDTRTHTEPCTHAHTHTHRTRTHIHNFCRHGKSATASQSWRRW